MVDDRTAPIASQYKKLFRLPSTNIALFGSILISLIVSMPFYFISSQVVKGIMFTLCILTFVIGIAFIDSHLTSFSPISSIRRALFALFFQLFPLIILSSCSLFLLPFGLITSSYFLSISMLATSYCISVRFFLLYTLYYQSLRRAIFPSLLLPISIYVLILVMFQTTPLIVLLSIIFGFILLGSTIIYIRYVDKVGLKLIEVSSLKLLVSYLQSWISSVPDELEAILEKYSIKSIIKTYQISLCKNGEKVSLIIPGIHPGPFAPIGSYNLPADVVNFFKKSVPAMVFHSPSSHAINLPSRKELEKYLVSLDTQEKMQMTKGSTCSKPLKISKNKATVTGLMFNDVVIAFMSLAPYGVEDLPPEISDYAKQFIDKEAIKDIILIDSHNSLGPTISDQDLGDLKDCLRLLTEKLKNEPKFDFSFGFASLNYGGFREIGEGGISCLCFSITSKCYILYSIDSNNAIPSFKLNLEQELASINISLLEICTTDSHFSSGKMETEKGYYALGELSAGRELIKKLVDLAVSVCSRTEKGHFDIKYCSSTLRIIGQEQIDRYSKFLKKVLSHAKKGVIILTIVAILILFIFVLSIDFFS
ncbi:MAG: DUF2070 family protein [Nitrososphaeria archaeon]